MDIKKIGTRIKEIRKQKGLTQIEVANRAGIAVNSLRLYEGNKREPRFEQLIHIADALDVSIDDFFDPYLSSKVENAVEQTWQLFYKIYKIDKHDVFIDMLLNIYSTLNTTGKAEALKRIEELTHIDKYTEKE